MILCRIRTNGSIGQFFVKIKNFFIGEGSFFKRIGTVIDGVVDSIGIHWWGYLPK